jgi:hypothetical protein
VPHGLLQAARASVPDPGLQTAVDVQVLAVVLEHEVDSNRFLEHRVLVSGQKFARSIRVMDVQGFGFEFFDLYEH